MDTEFKVLTRKRGKREEVTQRSRLGYNTHVVVSSNQIHPQIQATKRRQHRIERDGDVIRQQKRTLPRRRHALQSKTKVQKPLKSRSVSEECNDALQSNPERKKRNKDLSKPTFRGKSRRNDSAIDRGGARGEERTAEIETLREISERNRPGVLRSGNRRFKLWEDGIALDGDGHNESRSFRIEFCFDANLFT